MLPLSAWLFFGVFFIRGQGVEMVIEPDGKLMLRIKDASLGRMVEFKVDMVILEI